jgi:hypothetical protein
MENLIYLSTADLVAILVHVIILMGIACWAGFAKNNKVMTLFLPINRLGGLQLDLRCGEPTLVLPC